MNMKSISGVITLLLLAVVSGCGSSAEEDMMARAEAFAEQKRKEREAESAAVPNPAAAVSDVSNAGPSQSPPRATAVLPDADLSVADASVSNGPSSRASAASSPSSPQSPATAGSDDIVSQSETAAALDTGGILPVNQRKPADSLTPSQRRARAISNLRKISTAQKRYLREREALPFVNIYNNQKELFLSWRVRLLPFLGHQKLYDLFQKDEPWDSDHNIKLLPYIPDVYVSPERFDIRTNYLAFSGDDYANMKLGSHNFERVADRIAATLGLVEADDANAVPWTKPADFTPSPEAVMAGMGALRQDGAFAVYVTGGLALLKPGTSNDKLLAAIQIKNRDKTRDSQGFETPDAYSGPVATMALPSSTATPTTPIAADTQGRDDGGFATLASSTASQSSIGTSAMPALTVGQGQLREAGLSYGGQARGGRQTPSSSDLKKSNEQLRELFGKAVAEAKSESQRSNLARRMMLRRSELSADSSGTFALLNIARSVATTAGDFAIVRNATRAMTEEFDVDPYDVEKKAVGDFGRQVSRVGQPIDVHGFSGMAIRVLYNATQRDEYDVARACLVAMQQMMARGDRSVDEATVRQLASSVSAAQRQYEQVIPFVESLASNPNDPVAAVRVGSYLCFIKGNWSEGLPLLENSSAEALRRAARTESQAGSSASALQAVEIGDAWWHASDKLTDPMLKRLCKGRSIHWYELVLPQLGETLDRLRIKGRLRSISGEKPPASLLQTIQRVASAMKIK